MPKKKWYFEWFWRILSLLFTVPPSRRTRVESIFWTAPAPEQFYPRKLHRSTFKTCHRKLERFTLLFIPSDQKSIQRPRASPNPTVFEQSKCAARFTCASQKRSLWLPLFDWISLNNNLAYQIKSALTQLLLNHLINNIHSKRQMANPEHLL